MKVFVGIVALCLSLPCFAQSVVMLYDTSDVELGVAVSLAGQTFTFVDDQGVVIATRGDSGFLNTTMPVVYFTEDDCNGDSYYLMGENAYDRLARVDNGVLSHQVILVPAYNAGKVNVDIESQAVAGVCSDQSFSGDYLPLDLVTPADYGMTYLDSMQFGWPPPLKIKSIQVATQESLFCSGFEECPTE